MGEQDRPTIADPFVEVNLALSGMGCKVRSFVIDS